MASPTKDAYSICCTVCWVVLFIAEELEGFAFEPEIAVSLFISNREMGKMWVKVI